MNEPTAGVQILGFYLPHRRGGHRPVAVPRPGVDEKVWDGARLAREHVDEQLAVQGREHARVRALLAVRLKMMQYSILVLQLLLHLPGDPSNSVASQFWELWF